MIVQKADQGPALRQLASTLQPASASALGKGTCERIYGSHGTIVSNAKEIGTQCQIQNAS